MHCTIHVRFTTVPLKAFSEQVRKRNPCFCIWKLIIFICFLLYKRDYVASEKRKRWRELLQNDVIFHISDQIQVSGPGTVVNPVCPSVLLLYPLKGKRWNLKWPVIKKGQTQLTTVPFKIFIWTIMWNISSFFGLKTV